MISRLGAGYTDSREKFCGGRMRAAIAAGYRTFVLLFSSPTSLFECLKSPIETLTTRSRENTVALSVGSDEKRGIFLGVHYQQLPQERRPIVLNARKRETVT
jgi:hypothetical protein